MQWRQVRHNNMLLNFCWGANIVILHPLVLSTLQTAKSSFNNGDQCHNTNYIFVNTWRWTLDHIIPLSVDYLMSTLSTKSSPGNPRCVTHTSTWGLFVCFVSWYWKNLYHVWFLSNQGDCINASIPMLQSTKLWTEVNFEGAK